MDIDDTQICSVCGGSFSVRGILELIDGYWAEIDVVKARTPCCNDYEELELSSGKVTRGYVYAAGSAHFCGVQEYQAPDLVVTKDGRTLTYEINGKQRSI